MNINKVMHRSCGLFLIPFILTGCVSIHEETGTYLSVQSSSETEIVKYIEMNLIVDSVPVLEDEDVHIRVDLEGGIF